MAELEGQMNIFDVLPGELEGEPSAARALKILAKAEQEGWTENPVCSLVLRLTRGDALPFFARWDLSFNPESGKKSWRFQGARAMNGQPLAYNDIPVYLEDPSVIYPEPPTSPEDDSEESFRTALGSLNPLGPTASPLDPKRLFAKRAKPEPGFTDWGALLS
jgi:hypothetical protein